MTLKPPTGSDSELLALIEGDVIEYSLAEAGVRFYTTATLADAGTDSTTLIQTAADLCKANGWRLTRGKGAGGEFVKTTNRITFADIELDLCDVIFRVAMTYPLASEKAAVMCYQSGAQFFDRVSKRTLKLPRVQNVKPSSIARWITAAASVNDIGLQLANCEGCDIYVPEASGFSVGLDTVGDGSAGGAGFVYNTVRIGYLIGNRINHRLGQKSLLGWCNSNTFLGGAYAHFDGEGGTGTRVAGTRHISIPDIANSSYQVNGNVWYGSSFENATSEYDVESYGRDCTWNACRWEKSGSTSRVFFRFGSTTFATRNVVDGGFGASLLAATVEAGCTNNVIKWAEGEQQLGTLTTRSKLGNYVYSFENAPVLRRSGAGSAQTGALFIQGESFARLSISSNGDMQRGDGTATAAVWFLIGPGSPESNITANVGSIYQRSNGDAGRCVYYKAAGTGNTGWVPLGTDRYQTVATDADFTPTPVASFESVRHTGVLTANRAVTLSAGFQGQRWRFTRTGGGAFNLNVGTGPLKALVTNTWCETTYDGSNWYLSAYGAL